MGSAPTLFRGARFLSERGCCCLSVSVAICAHRHTPKRGTEWSQLFTWEPTEVSAAELGHRVELWVLDCGASLMLMARHVVTNQCYSWRDFLLSESLLQSSKAVCVSGGKAQNPAPQTAHKPARWARC